MQRAITPRLRTRQSRTKKCSRRPSLRESQGYPSGDERYSIGDCMVAKEVRSLSTTAVWCSKVGGLLVMWQVYSD